MINSRGTVARKDGLNLPPANGTSTRNGYKSKSDEHSSLDTFSQCGRSYVSMQARKSPREYSAETTALLQQSQPLDLSVHPFDRPFSIRRPCATGNHEFAIGEQ